MPQYKYQTKDGKTKWYANFYYIDWMGERKHKCKRGFASKKEAKEWENDFLNQGAKDPTLTFSALVNNYLETMETRLKPTTLKGKKYLIETKLIPYFGKTKICDIDPIMVRKWQDALINYRDENGKGYTATYLKSINNQLSAIMNHAVTFYKLPINPCRVTGSMGKSRADEMKIWTQEQFQEFIEHEKKSAYRMAFNILYYAGIREGELLALTPEDIPSDQARLNINKNYAIVDGEEMFLTPKTEKGVRTVTIPQSLHDELLTYIESMAIGPEERIFYFGKYGLTSEFKRLTKEVGLPPIRIHDLRHSHASLLINMGRSVKEIADRLGHESPQTTLRTYAHMYPGTEIDLANELDKIRIAESDENEI